MTSQRYTALIATVSNALDDVVLDYAVNRFNYYKILFWSSFVAFAVQIAAGFATGFSCPVQALPAVAVHALLILAGYVFFVKGIRHIPVALAGLIEAGGLFLTFAIDAAIGYVNATPSFAALLALFVFSVFLFHKSSLKTGNGSKDIRPVGIVFVSLQVLCYSSAPYLIKIAAAKGANEIAINGGHYLLALPFFAWQALRFRGKSAQPPQKGKLWTDWRFLCLAIGSLEAVAWIFETFSFINDAPTIVVVIEQIRIFLLFLLSVLFKTDKFTVKKLLALILGGLSVAGIYMT